MSCISLTLFHTKPFPRGYIAWQQSTKSLHWSHLIWSNCWILHSRTKSIFFNAQIMQWITQFRPYQFSIQSLNKYSHCYRPLIYQFWFQIHAKRYISKSTIARGYSWFLCRGIKRNWAIQPTSHTQIHAGLYMYMPAGTRRLGWCRWYCVNADELFCVDFKHSLVKARHLTIGGRGRKWFHNKKLPSQSCFWVQHNCCCPSPSCQIQSTVGTHIPHHCVSVFAWFSIVRRFLRFVF